MVAGKSHGDYASFQKKKGKLIKIFEEAMLATLAKMGEDIKGISWFSSSAEKHAATRLKKAA
ncbi:MAG: hypothetical protein ACRETO_03740 [Gammaproteobacteria bacterium]